MRLLLYIALGGALGSASRFALAGLVQQRMGAGFPLGTLAVNVAGSFLLGVLLRFTLDTAAVSPELRALLTTGFCGGFTTFSTFSYETVALFQEGDYRRAALYVVASVVLSLAAMLGGLELARVVAGARHGG